MHLLYICETIDYGVGQNLHDLVIQALSNGNQVTLIWSEKRTGIVFKDWINSISNAGFKSHIIPMTRSPSPSDLGVLLHSIKIARKAKTPIDIVHGFSSKGGAIARIIGTILGIPRYYSPHAYILSNPSLSQLQKRFYYLIEKTLNMGAYVVCTSSEEIEISKMIGCKGYKFIPNGINLNEVKEESNNTATNRIQVSFVGRLCDQKNPLLFLQVAEYLVDLPIDFHIFGEGELMDDVVLNIAPNLRSRIHIHGRVSITEIWKYTNILLCTSKYEGFPYIFIQCIARGIPIISTRVGGIESVIDDGINGIVFDQNSMEKIHRFIEDFSSNREFREKATTSAITKSRNFSIETMYQSLIEFYQIERPK